MGRQEVVPFLFEVNIIFAGESFAEKIGEGIPSHEDNPTERRSYDDALYKHFASIVFVWVHHALAPATVCTVYSNK